MPLDHVVHTVIDEEESGSGSSYRTTLRVRMARLVVEPPSVFEAPATRRLDDEPIPGEKISFSQLTKYISSGLVMATRLSLTRSYYRYIPKNVEIKGILIQFGGWKQSCEDWERKSNTSAVADKYGFILLTACGSEFGMFSTIFKTKPGFDAGACCTSRDIDDVEYVKTILYRENSRRLPIYGYGYSNGGMMVQTLLCHKVIISGVTLNGILAIDYDPESSFAKCDEVYHDPRHYQWRSNTSMANIHCLDDERVPFDGLPPPKLKDRLNYYFGAYVFPGAKLPAVDRNMIRWAERVGCEATTSTTNISQWTQQIEWSCPPRKRVVSIQRSNCTYHGRAHRVIKTSDLDPASWAAEFFLGIGTST
ncbi:hypothetical protein FOL47_005706 [Perkinsus chesapeaki]|uniref:Uncharacterized protein n=1 Tax=Perkinsus chesapeaki TaxID=330153 RepID=A0A7J6LXJ9_PERCH|nr:hypothetical protein FOL47_005706 [Perkinsus chesapeaki]